MFTRSIKRMTDEQLADGYLRWSSALDDWRDFASQYPDDRRACRAARRGIARCRRQLRHIRAVAHQRRLAL
jgi:hypothetical protein